MTVLLTDPTVMQGTPRHPALRAAAVTRAYVGAVVLAELAAAFWSPLAGAVVNATVLVVLVNHFLLTSGATRPAGSLAENPYASLGPLALVPFIGLLRVALPTADLPVEAWYGLIGGSVLIAGISVAPCSAKGVLSPGRWRWRTHAAVAAAGLPLGLVAYALLAPPPLVSGSGGRLLLGQGAVALAALAEEVVFRGVLQPALVRLFGSSGILLTVGLSMAVVMGTHSPAAVMFAGAVALGAGVTAQRSRSVVGVAAARAIAAFIMVAVAAR